MLFFPVFAKLQPRPDPPAAPRAFHTDDWPDRLQISYAKDSNGRLYPFSFQSLVVSSSPSPSHGVLCIPFIFLSLRTLSFATGGYTPLAQSFCTASSPTSFISRRPSHFSSTTYKMLFQQPLCFDNHPFSWGVYPPLKRNVFRAGSAREVVRDVEDQYQRINIR
jgi:hypothetical protein